MRFLKLLEKVIIDTTERKIVEKYLQAVQTYNELAGEGHKHKILYQIISDYLCSKDIDYSDIHVIGHDSVNNKKVWIVEVSVTNIEGEQVVVQATVDYNTLLINREFESELIKINCFDFECED